MGLRPNFTIANDIAINITIRFTPLIFFNQIDI